MEKQINYASDVKIGDFAIVHNAMYETHESIPSQNIYGPKTYHAATFPSYKPFCIGRIGRLRDATIERRLSKDIISQAELILADSLLPFTLGTFKGENLYFIKTEKDIRDYFGEQKEHLTFLLWEDRRQTTIDDILKKALADYKILKDTDVTKLDLSRMGRLITLGSSLEIAKMTAEMQTELARKMHEMKQVKKDDLIYRIDAGTSRPHFLT